MPLLKALFQFTIFEAWNMIVNLKQIQSFYFNYYSQNMFEYSLRLRIAPLFFVGVHAIVALWLFLYPMERKQFFIHVCLMVASVFLYFLVHLSEPGILKNLLNQEIKFQLQENNKLQQDTWQSNSNEQISSIPSKRICNICSILQPYRTKHCQDCQKCICTFDHHCPWVDNCIGQKNRHFLLAFAFIQSINGWFTLLKCIFLLYQNGDKSQMSITLTTMIGVITMLMSSLFCTHFFLMISNLTTWQLISWKKISYLNGRQRKGGSPFGSTFYENIKQYWLIGFSNQLKQWQFKI